MKKLIIIVICCFINIVMAKANVNHDPFVPIATSGANMTVRQLHWQVVHVNYANIENILKTIKAMLAPGEKVIANSASRLLLIKASKMDLQAIDKVIIKIDKKVPQILIEVRIVEINENALDELGVAMAHSMGSAKNIPSMSVGSKSGLNVALGALAGISAPLKNPVGILDLAIGKLPGGFMLDLELQALESEGEGRVISTPHVLVSNGSTATIEQGKEVPYQASAGQGATQVMFKKAVLGLRVTPQVGVHNNIKLALQINKDAVSHNLAKASNVPIIDTREIKTQVLVKNKQTIVLGGIFEQSNNHNIKRVPFFGKLPGVGSLFRSTTDNKQRSEVLVFVTPRVLL